MDMHDIHHKGIAGSEGGCRPARDLSALQETARWKQYILDHPKESKISAARTSLAVQESPLKYELQTAGTPAGKTWTKTLQIPKFFTQEDKAEFENLCSTFYTIFEKTIQAYKGDPKVRRLFRFSPILENMILRDPGYSTAIPMLRIDIFYNEETGTWQVCEFNTDGTSAMFENDMMYGFLPLNNAWNALQPETEYMELTQKWADAFLSVWEESGQEGQPSIVITDFLENAYMPELEAFVQVFRDRGLVCELEDIRNLDYDGMHLLSARTGTRYTMVYRRAVTGDIIQNYHDVIPFMAAISNGAALLVGDFQTQLIHSKMISEALQSAVLRAYFTREEILFLDTHMPATFDLKGPGVERVLHNKDQWIIKPKESYGAKGVWAGVDVPARLWDKLVRDFADTQYIAQTYIPHYRSDNVDLLEAGEFRPYANMTGLYVYNGKFAGVYSRLADAGIISSQYNEHMVPTLFLKNTEKESEPQPQEIDGKDSET